MAQPAPPRPRVLVALAAGLTLAGCGVNERDPHRFETLAESVAAIPVSAEAGRGAALATPTASDRMSPKPPLKVELMTPHELWDARDGMTGRVRMAAVAVPSDLRDPEAGAAPSSRATSAPPVSAAAPVAATRPVQLGAFASEAGARAAWARLSRGPDAAVLAGLQPLYEGVEVEGRRLIRLKVAATPDRAQALCRVLASSDPWCARAAETRPSTGAA